MTENTYTASDAASNAHFNALVNNRIEQITTLLRENPAEQVDNSDPLEVDRAALAVVLGMSHGPIAVKGFVRAVASGTLKRNGDKIEMELSPADTPSGAKETYMDFTAASLSTLLSFLKGISTGAELATGQLLQQALNAGMPAPDGAKEMMCQRSGALFYEAFRVMAKKYSADELLAMSGEIGDELKAVTN